MRRLAVFGCSTPLLAALSRGRAAGRRASWKPAGSLGARASRAFFTADFTCVRTAWFLARRFSACRFRFWADLVFATGGPPYRPAPPAVKGDPASPVTASARASDPTGGHVSCGEVSLLDP